MRWLVLAALAACDFQPPPKPQPAPPTTVPPAPTVGSAGSGSGSGSAGSGSAGSGSAVAVPEGSAAAPADAAASDVSNACVETGAHIAQVLIDSEQDPGTKAQYEQARSKIVRATAEACTKQTWSDDKRRCFDTTKTEADIRACEKKFPQPAPQPGQKG
jgi:hypothetical protein